VRTAQALPHSPCFAKTSTDTFCNQAAFQLRHSAENRENHFPSLIPSLAIGQESQAVATAGSHDPKLLCLK
jgi:hypothetical protein